MTPADLAALSEAATPGMWDEHSTGLITGGSDGLDEIAAYCGGDDRRFIVALVIAYRSGDLVLIDREGMREKVWQVLEDLLCPLCNGDGCDGCGHSGEPSQMQRADAAIAAILGEGKDA